MRSCRARTSIRSAIVSSLSGCTIAQRPASVRSASARTNASNRSSLLPAALYRARSDFTCRALMTTTSNPSRIRCSTTGPSPRSIPTRSTPCRRSSKVIFASPGRVCGTVASSMRCPSSSTMHSAWCCQDQSIPA
jgi:hypothetical protein